MHYACDSMYVCVSCSVFVTLWIVVHQAPLSMEFSRQKYWIGEPFPSPGYLPKPGIEPRSPELQADSLLSEPPGKPLVPLYVVHFLNLTCIPRVSL